MRVLDTRTLRFVEFDEPGGVEYAILSHTWDPGGEQTLQQLCELQREYPDDSILDAPLLSKKIRDFCIYARKRGYKYAWADSCCIDKTSSAELSESINSMYAWYQKAHACYVYLSDVNSTSLDWKREFRDSRWHTRGWTLQELIAPEIVEFLFNDWSVIGSKSTLSPLLEDITGIDADVLTSKIPLSAVSVACRMSWAASRDTIRPEDHAYSLFGVFGVHLPTVYGEGRDRAFFRLQEAILTETGDHSIFAWGLGGLETQLRTSNIVFELHRSSEDFTFQSTWEHALLASSPDEFKESSKLIRVPKLEFEATFRLVPKIGCYLDFSVYGRLTRVPVYRIHAQVLPVPTYIAPLPCRHPSKGWVALVLGQEVSPPYGFTVKAPVSTPAEGIDGSKQLEYIRATYIPYRQAEILWLGAVSADMRAMWFMATILVRGRTIFRSTRRWH